MAEHTIFGGVTTAWQGVIGNSAYELDSTEFYVTSSAWLTALRFYRPGTSLYGTIKTAVYRVNSTSSGTEVSGTNGNFSLSNGSGSSGWQTRTLATPVALTVNQRYRVAIKWATGRTASTSTSYFDTQTVNGPLVAPSNANATGGYNSWGVNTNSSGGAIGYPGSFSGSIGLPYAYPIDVVVTDVNPDGTPGTGFLPFFAA